MNDDNVVKCMVIVAPVICACSLQLHFKISETCSIFKKYFFFLHLVPC